MFSNSLCAFITVFSLFVRSILCCGPDHSSATPLDQSSLIAANNLARPNRTIIPKKIALDNVRVFDGTCILPPSTVIIDGPLIGSDPTGAEHIDGQGGVLLPGFIDAHCHPSSIAHMQDLAKWGVTTGFVMACYAPELCNSLDNHPGLSSILRSSAPASAPGSVHGNITAMINPSLLVNETGEVPAWMKYQLANLAPDYFKFVAETPGLDQETLNLLVTEAKGHAKQSVIHAADQTSYTQAILSAAEHIHHAPLDSALSQASIETMLQNKQVSTPTLTMMRAISQNSKRNFTAALETTALLHKAGVPILAGTDANLQPGVPAQVPFGISLHDELENLVEAGMSNLEALLAATLKPARAFGLRDRGTVQVGMRADLVLMGGDPFEDIRNTRDIRKVWTGGVEVPLQN